MLLNSIFVGVVVGYVALFVSAMMVKIRVDKKVTNDEEVATYVLTVNGEDEHKLTLEEIYTDAEEFLNKEYGKPLENEEIVLLHELFERAKRDERFKDGLKDIKLSDIYYDAMFIKLKVFDDKRGDVDEGN